MLRIESLQGAIDARICELYPAVIAAARLLMEDVNRKTGAEWQVVISGEEPGFWKGEEENENFGWNERSYPIVDEYASPDQESVRLAIPVYNGDVKMMLYLHLTDGEDQGTQVSIYSYNSSLCYNALNLWSFSDQDRLEPGIVQVYRPDFIGFFGAIGGHTPKNIPDQEYNVWMDGNNLRIEEAQKFS